MDAKYNPGTIFQGKSGQKKTRKITHKHFPKLTQVKVTDLRNSTTTTNTLEVEVMMSPSQLS